MTGRYWLTCFLLGTLGAFAAWSVAWAQDDRFAGRLGLPGDTSRGSFLAGPPDPGGASSSEVLAFLRREGLTLLVASTGEGPPQVAAYNAYGSAAWLPAEPVVHGGETASAYLFRPSWSATRWDDGRRPSTVPDDFEVLGTVPAPPGADRLQYLVLDPPDPLPVGDFVLSSSRPEHVRELGALASASGLRSVGSRPDVTALDLARNPLVVFSGVLLATGMLAAAAYWFIALEAYRAETAVRRVCGGSRAAIVRTYLVRHLPAPVAAAPAGALATVVVARVATQRWPEYLTTVLAAGLATALGACALLLLTVTARVSRQAAGA